MKKKRKRKPMKLFVVKFFSITGQQTGTSDPMLKILAEATAESWGQHNSGFATVHPIGE